ncbi:MAG: ABC transporter substrate-binding protein [Deltaproteobacteria bacterium]|jgi:ABC-type uncharacterized transport system substrate-binding protein|nr:ABC transporter substrate-binding protein [Deltaproteobacteria bacterium]
MWRERQKTALNTAIFLIVFATAVLARPETPLAAPNSGRPARIAYIEGGFYANYALILVALARGLAELGLLDNGNAPVGENPGSTEEIWRWLSANAGGTAVEFVSDGYYSAGWDDAVFERKRSALVARLNDAQDIDLVLAFGTKAGQAMATDEHHTPVVALSVTDAVTAGIIASPENSGREHVFAVVDSNRYYRELVLFHDIFQFSKLGFVYDDAEPEHPSIALSQIRKAAQDAGFELAPCVGAVFSGDPDLAAMDLITCHERLVEEGVEAVYMTFNHGTRAEIMGDILRPLLEARLPTFSQNGVDEVRLGALMGISQANFEGQGTFAAGAVANIISGQSPSAQKQSYEEPLSLVLNLRTATLIGWNPSLAFLAAMDEIFLSHSW